MRNWQTKTKPFNFLHISLEGLMDLMAGVSHSVISHNQRWHVHVPGSTYQSYKVPSGLNTYNSTDVTHLGSWNFSHDTHMWQPLGMLPTAHTEVLTPVCSAAVMCLPDGLELALLTSYSSYHCTNVHACLSVVCSSPADCITNRTHAIFHI